MTAERTPEFRRVSFVAVGSFNPAIFQPAWFAETGLIRKEESESAKINVISSDVTVFETEWFSLQVLHDQFVASTNDPTKHLPLRDLVLGTFRILEHTPIMAFGINDERHYRMESEEKWHQFGHFFVPKDPWKDLLEQPGTRTLSVEGSAADCKSSRIRIRVEPSIKVSPGVYFHVNQHYNLERKNEQDEDQSVADRMNKMLVLVKTEWESVMKYDDQVATRLFDAAGL